MSTVERSGGLFSLRTIAWGVLALAGSLLWLFFVTGADSQRAWRSLLFNFLFFTSLAGGLVVWPAVVRTCNGRWAEGLERLAAAAIAFSVPSLVALLLLWIGSPHWSPWFDIRYHQGWWLDNTFVFARDMAALLLFWGIAFRQVYEHHPGQGGIRAPLLVLVYALVFSLIGFDLVMALDPEWFSTLAGGYFFISGLYIAITGWAFLAVWHPSARREQLQDLGRLMVAFSLMTTYLMYAHLLPMWYENLPEEVRFIVPRMNVRPWQLVGFLLLAVVYFGPLVLLLTERSKGNRWTLGGISLLVLTGLWLERWWLVAPTFDSLPRFGLVELSLAAAFSGIFALCLQLFERRLAPVLLHKKEE